jgi:hypothetical protein
VGRQAFPGGPVARANPGDQQLAWRRKDDQQRRQKFPRASVPRLISASVAAAAQLQTANDVSQSTAGCTNAETGFLSKAVKHYWYGDTSPWTERFENNFKDLQSRPDAKVVILDRENPPQPRTARTVERED